MKGNHIAIFAAGVVCTLAVVAAGLWFCGLLAFGDSDAQAQGDPIVEAPDPKSKELPEDTTDLMSLNVKELSQYYYDVFSRKIKRNREDICAAITRLTQEDIDYLCDGFRNAHSNSDLRRFSLMLADIGTDQTIRALGTYYKREDLQNDYNDEGVSEALGSSGRPLAKKILIDAFERLEFPELRKAIAGGLSHFQGKGDVAATLISGLRRSKDEGEIMALLFCLGIVGTDEGAEFLRDAAMGKGVDLGDLRRLAINAFRRSSHPRAVGYVEEIAFHPDCQEVVLQKKCVSVLGSLAQIGRDGAVDVLCDLALMREGTSNLSQLCIVELKKLPKDKVGERIKRLAESLKDPELKKSLE